MENFKDLKHFKKEEFPEPEKMNRDLLLKLDGLRSYVNASIIITFSTNGIHTEDSQHYKGNAVDIIVPDFKGSLFSLYLVAERFNFNGMGLYPEWRYNGRRIGGLHLDERPLTMFQGARWIGILGEGGKNKYIPLNVPNLISTKILTNIHVPEEDTRH